jgi:hypothetical protein
MSNEKTIRMPKELLDKWLAALRGGEYKQAKSRLSDESGYCCLGLLQVMACGDVERYENGESKHYPSTEWLGTQSIEFVDHNVDGPGWTPYLPTLDNVASNANDDGKTFAEIADAIEACAEGV